MARRKRSWSSRRPGRDCRGCAHVHLDLLLSDNGRRTAAELTGRLKISPATVSVAVKFLLQLGFIRRDRAPRRRRSWSRSAST
ncbi:MULTISPECIES: winged helix-turn-helix domain-containing protein [unclassified Nonomuraea]|uniref:winged helix-turn-helix domain-containing protein n=1 Tax=unclassified Nonomuraea TaxID=2593643 RepID=UPI00340DCC12